ncbi:hypothetical protein, partial [Kitasatospora nipponensis]|uniref:hypothetical protein n=1 Tax=Kitasatospora nipponensis TaxID=258049 RepID=UPI0031D3EB3A
MSSLLGEPGARGHIEPDEVVHLGTGGPRYGLLGGLYEFSSFFSFGTVGAWLVRRDQMVCRPDSTAGVSGASNRLHRGTD